MNTVGVELGARRYDVLIGTPSLDQIADALARALRDVTGVAVLVDAGMATVSARAAGLVEALRTRLPGVKRHDLPAGEACKNLREIERTTEWLAAEGYDRRAAVIGLGGGATTDHAGFCAAIYLRGVAFAAVPTTLLAMVDASVGGKTGVDLAAGKNLVGAFHQPRIVVADLAFLSTLPHRELAAGMAEAVKCGFIEDPRLLDLFERHGADLPPEAMAEVVARSVRVKAAVVTEDEHEAGRRATLNFGHTIGHAFEAESGYALLHGEAVSLGMVAALAFGASQRLTHPDLVARATALLKNLGLPVDYGRRMSPAVLARVGVDKKRRGAAIRFVFCPEAGETLLRDVTMDDLAAFFTPAVARGKPLGAGTRK